VQAVSARDAAASLGQPGLVEKLLSLSRAWVLLGSLVSAGESVLAWTQLGKNMVKIADAALEKVLPGVAGPGKHRRWSLVSAPLPEQTAAEIEAFLVFLPLHKFHFQSRCLLCLTSFSGMKSLYPCPK